jgi:hypothetical protein
LYNPGRKDLKKNKKIEKGIRKMGFIVVFFVMALVAIAIMICLETVCQWDKY